MHELLTPHPTNHTQKNPDRLWTMKAASAPEATALARSWTDAIHGEQTPPSESTPSVLALAATTSPSSEQGLTPSASPATIGSAAASALDRPVSSISQSTSALAGWFVKKAEKHGKDRRRFFVLKGSEVVYFEGEGSGMGETEKGRFALHRLSNISAETTHLAIQNPDRTWVLTAESEALVRLWATRLTAVKDALAAEASSAVDLGESAAQVVEELAADETDAEVDATEENLDLPVSGLLYKKGEGLGRLTGPKVRFFRLVQGKNTGQLKFRYYDTDKAGHPHSLKGCIVVGDFTKITKRDLELQLVSGSCHERGGREIRRRRRRQETETEKE
jgi:hypothetical protein